jgi:hypothetical protein
MVVDQNGATGSAAQRQRELSPLAAQMVVRGIQLDLTNDQMLTVVKSAQRQLRPG